MQKRKVAGGLVAAGVLVGAYFSGLLGKFGAGTGNGTGDGTGTKPVVASTRPADANAAPTPKAADVTAKPTTPTDPKAAAAKTTATVKANAETKKPTQPENRTMPEKFAVLDIYVKGHNYQVKEPVSGDMLKVDLPNLIKLAKRATGDDSGLKVRINRYRDARVVGWSRLCAELESAGFEREKDFVMPHDLLEIVKADPAAAPKK